MATPASTSRQDRQAAYKARYEKIEKELKSHTLPQPPLIVRIPFVGLPDSEVKSRVIQSLATYEHMLGRDLEWKERDRLAHYFVANTASFCWMTLTFPAVMALVHTGLKTRRIRGTILAKVPPMAISIPAGLVGAGYVIRHFHKRLENNIRSDPDLRQSYKERAQMRRLTLNEVFNDEVNQAHEAQSRQPFPVPSSQPSPPDSRPDSPDDDQPSWPQTLQDQDPFGNRPPPQPPTTQDPTWEAQDDPLNEVEGSAGSAPGTATGASYSSWDRLRAQNAAPTTTPQQTWAERRRAALEKTISDKGGDPASSYAGHDEEGARAQERAQREFDEMLERERRSAEDRGSGGGGRGGSGERRW